MSKIMIAAHSISGAWTASRGITIASIGLAGRKEGGEAASFICHSGCNGRYVFLNFSVYIQSIKVREEVSQMCKTTILFLFPTHPYLPSFTIPIPHSKHGNSNSSRPPARPGRQASQCP